VAGIGNDVTFEDEVGEVGKYLIASGLSAGDMIGVLMWRWPARSLSGMGLEMLMLTVEDDRADALLKAVVFAFFSILSLVP